MPEHKDSPNNVIHEMVMHKLRKRIEHLQENVFKEVYSKLDVFVDELVNDLNRFDTQDSESALLFKEQNGKESKSVKRAPSTDANHLPEKEFVARNSLLNDLFEIKHIKTIYHIFIAILFILWLNTLVHDYVADGTINLGFGLIKIGFGKFHLTFFIWCILQTGSCAIYVGFRVWATVASKRSVRTSKDGKYDVFNKVVLGVFSMTQMGLIYGTVRLVIFFDLSPASSIGILTDMLRFVMKNHAFVRSNTPRVLIAIQNSEGCKGGNDIVPTFQKFIYFMFAPTMVYRDHYPRTKYIRWRRVLWNLMEFVGTILYMSFLFERFLLPYFRDFGTTAIQPQILVSSIFGCMIPGAMVCLCGFYCLLHAWLNATAEMLRFADRMFYKDWWNSSSFDVFARTWNVVVHDWLHTYIYKDVYEIVCKKSRAMSALAVFTTSAVCHELILSVAFRFFYPVLFVLFLGCGFQLMFIRIRKHETFGNTFLWIGMAFGSGVCVSLYSMEFFARKNCPMSHDSLWGYYVPISWSCNGILTNGSIISPVYNQMKIEL